MSTNPHTSTATCGACPKPAGCKVGQCRHGNDNTPDDDNRVEGREAWERRLRGRAGPFTVQPGERYVDADVALAAFRFALAASATPRTEAAEGREAVMEIIGWNNDATPRLRIYAKLHNLPAGTKLYAAPPAGDAAQEVVSWARPLYATDPAEGWEPGELVDIEFHNRAEKPEGEGWRPLVFADTGDGTAPLPRINIKCETVDNGITGVAFLKVIRVEQEDDGSLTAVTDHWPRLDDGGARVTEAMVREIVERYIGKANNVARYIADDINAALIRCGGAK